MGDILALNLDRRRFLEMSGVAAAALALAACSPGGGQQTTGNVTYWVQPNAAEEDMKAFFARLTAEFGEGQSAFSAKPLLVPWEDSLTKLTAAFSGGNPPDVSYQIIPWMNKWREAGVLADFRQIAPKADLDAFLENVNPALLAPVEGPNGELLGIPYVTGGAHQLTLNLNVWEAAGSPDLPTTYEEMAEFAKLLTIDTSGKRLGQQGFDSSNVASYGLTWPAFPAIQENYLWHYFWSFGTEYMSEDGTDIGFDNDEGRAALEFMKGMVDSGAATPAGLYTDESGWTNALASGASGMQWTGQFTLDQATQFPDARLQILEPPKGPGGEAYIVGACGYISVSAKSQRAEGAYELAKALLSNPLIDDYTRTILALPVHGSEGDFYTDLPDPRMNDFQNEAAKLNSFTRVLPQLKISPNEYLIGKINDYVLGNQSLDDMMTDCHAQIQQMAASV